MIFSSLHILSGTKVKTGCLCRFVVTAYWCPMLVHQHVMSIQRSILGHDVTKIQTKKLSPLLSFYFRVILQHLKTFKQTNFQFKRVLRFCDTGRLNFQAFAWRGIWLTARKALTWIKHLTDFGRFCYINIPCLRINITLIFMSSSSEEFTH